MLKLRKGMDRRFRAGHPWVYSNEIEGSFRDLEKGQDVILADPAGKFMARGYANPNSLITFRAVSRDEKETDALSETGLERRLRAAWELRRSSGKDLYSFRLSFGEADHLPGLIIDLWRVGQAAEGAAAIFAVQAHTAGADRWMEVLPRVLKKLTNEFLGNVPVGVIARNDVSVRKLEGISVDEPRWIEAVPQGLDPKQIPLWVRGPGQAALAMHCDWFSGQKTGFFLDQADNIQLLIQRLGAGKLPQKMRVIDLCCYVGQWSAQIAAFLKSKGIEAEFTLVDASAEALAFAEKNVREAGATLVKTAKLDVLHELGSLDSGSFDLVISDPPALVKSRKDLGPGTHAYLQLHTQAIRLVRPGAWLVACSCSALLSEEDFAGTLSKAGHRNGGQIRWIGRGGPAADHPILASFPEGRYLKCWIGLRI